MAAPPGAVFAVNPSTPAETGEKGRSSSKTVTDTITGEHEHTIVGYSLVKGIGDGEPIASERFIVGGHEWVLLFYPDGKRSSSTEGPLNQGGGGAVAIAGPQPGNFPGNEAAQPAGPADNNAAAPLPQPAAQGAAPNQAAVANAGQNPQAVMGYPPAAPQGQAGNMHRREQTNDYAALFVALIGETDNPQGVVNTSDGRVVRAFHRFTLVDQLNQSRDLTKGRRRDQGAVKISCARQDPNARNCHGYRKFVKRSVLENPQAGYLLNDTIIIKYTIELVVSSGGALSKQTAPPVKQFDIQVPTPSFGTEFGKLLDNGEGADVTFKVEDEEMKAHRLVLSTRSPVFAGMLRADMRENQEGVVTVQDVRAPVFRALLYFIYTDSLPEELEGNNLDVAMAQHLLVAADRFELQRLRRISERHLCETVEVGTVATTATLAEQNRGAELKRVCLEFISKNLSAVMGTDGYQHMMSTCPEIQSELLAVIAEKNASERAHKRRDGREHGVSEGPADAEIARRVRPRRE